MASEKERISLASNDNQEDKEEQLVDQKSPSVQSESVCITKVAELPFGQPVQDDQDLKEEESGHTKQDKSEVLSQERGD